MIFIEKFDRQTQTSSRVAFATNERWNLFWNIGTQSRMINDLLDKLCRTGLA